MLIKCKMCGVPAKECIPPLNMGWNDETAWQCTACYDAIVIRCSYCDKALPFDAPLPPELDDGSFLCTDCNTQLLEELDDFTNNFESYTQGPTGTPWYKHRLSSSPG